MRRESACSFSFRRGALALLALAAIAASLAACGGGDEDAALAYPRVLVGRVQVADFEERIEASGELAARDRATIAAEVSGRVTEVFAEEGAHVDAGESLLLIDREKHELQVTNARARFDEAHAASEEAQRDFERARALHERGISAEAVLDARRTASARAKSRFDAARADLGVAERALREAEVRAPFAGSVARREVSRGEYVRVGQALLELVSLDPVELEFNMAERDSARVALGQVVRVRVAPYPGEVFEGVVSVIAPTIDTRTRTLRVKARIANPDARLRPGLFARADLGIAQREDVLWVPAVAVQLRAEGQVVWRMAEDDRVTRVPVTTGLHDGDRIEVLSGLAAHDEIVVRGHTGLSDGLKVLRRSAEGGEAPQLPRPAPKAKDAPAEDATRARDAAQDTSAGAKPTPADAPRAAGTL